MFSARQAPCVRQPGARRKEACPGQYLPVAWGSRLQLQLRVDCTLLARSRAVQCVKATTTGSFLPAGWRVLAGQEGQLPWSWVLASGSWDRVFWHGQQGCCGMALGHPPGPPRGVQSTRVPLGSCSIYTTGLRHLRSNRAGGRRGGRSVRAVLVPLRAAGAGAGLRAMVTDTALPAATSGHLFLASGTGEGTQWEAGSRARRS